ncbi:unnamed protein product [Symbiodinium sp. KB8]|nr:unnamed protein product [Symbiodinium sp. KB8]
MLLFWPMLPLFGFERKRLRESFCKKMNKTCGLVLWFIFTGPLAIPASLAALMLVYLPWKLAGQRVVKVLMHKAKLAMGWHGSSWARASKCCIWMLHRSEPTSHELRSMRTHLKKQVQEIKADVASLKNFLTTRSQADRQPYQSRNTVS